MATLEFEVGTRGDGEALAWMEAPQEPDALELFERERARLFGIAYRMMGSAREAEDLVQDAYLRWRRVDVRGVENPSAFLARTVTRLALNAVKSAHHRRMQYVGLDVEGGAPVQPAPQRDPAAQYEMEEALSEALRLTLERLTPVERTVFLLHEVLGYSYADIAPLVGKTEENARQIERRARLHLADPGRARAVDPAQHALLLHLFLRAAREGEVAALVERLAQETREFSRTKSVTRH